MPSMKVKPAVPGAIIRDPQTRLPLPAEGGEVPDNSFWRRRLRAGEVVVLEEEVRIEEGPFDDERTGEVPTGREPLAPLITRGPRGDKE